MIFLHRETFKDYYIFIIFLQMSNTQLCFVLKVRYTGYRDRSHEERVSRFHSDCREGRCPIVRKFLFVFLQKFVIT